MKPRTDFTDLGVVCVIDFETTGLNPRRDRVVSVAAVRCDLSSPFRDAAGQTRFRTETFAEVLNPGVRISSASTAVHGFTDRDVADKRTFAEIADELLAFIGDTALVSHNMSFDGPFLDEELSRSGRRKCTAPRYCTMLAVHQRVMLLHGPNAKWPKLAESGPYVGVTFRQSATHNANEDALLALQLAVGLKTTRFKVEGGKPILTLR